MAVPDTIGVKYIGSKASLIGNILDVIDRNLAQPDSLRLIDVFTGTTRVAQAFRTRGWDVQSSDLSWASEAYAHAFIIRTKESGRRIPALTHSLWMELTAAFDSEKPPAKDWITTNYCDVSGVEGGLVRMWKPANGIRADFLRNRIAQLEGSGQITHHEAMILVCSLIFGLDKVDNSVGIQQAYLKDWAKRTDDNMAFLDLPYAIGPVAKHTVGNCLEIAYEPADVAYIDPPYSTHSYSTYYHIWDSITRWDKPAVGLKTNRRMDRVSKSEDFDESMKSLWNSKSTALDALLELCQRLPVKYLLISYNDESLIPHLGLIKALETRYGAANVQIVRIPYKRNIMSQIGNALLSDETMKTENTEMLIWVRKN